MPSPRSSPFARRRGSALLTVILFTIVMLILVESVLKLSLSERRLNSGTSNWLEARNAAEALAEYGFAQVRNQFSASTNPSANAAFFDPAGSNALALAPAAFFSGSHVNSSPVSSTNANGLEVMAGTVYKMPSSGQFFIDPNNPDNANDPMKGEWVTRSDVVVIARATVVPAIGSPVSAYVTEKVSVRGAPLFAHAIFYSNNDLEIFPGPQMDIYGPVHCNGNMFVSDQSNATGLSFHGPVTCTGNIYHAWMNSNSAAEGAGGETLGQNPVNFINKSGQLINLNSTGTATGWKDSTMGSDNGVTGLSSLQALVTGNTTTQFRQYASQTWNGNLQTGAMGIENYSPIAFNEIIGLDSSGNPTVTADPHSMIDPPALTTYLNPTDPTQTQFAAARQQVEGQKMATQSGLYVKVVIAAGSGGTPTATINLYGPAGSTNGSSVVSDTSDPLYNHPLIASYTNGTPTGLIIFTPAALSAGTTTTSAVTSYSVGAKVTTGTYSGKYPVTPTTVTTATASTTLSYSTGAVTSTPAPAVSTSTGSVTYNSSSSAPATTTSTTTSSAPVSLASGMFDHRRNMTVDLVQVDMTAMKAAVTAMITNTTSNAISYTDTSGHTQIWKDWNGSVYVDVEAPNSETSAQSASVRIVNGTVATGSSLIPSAASTIAGNPNGDGFTLATNAPLYIKGSFNADGTGSGSPTLPDDGNDGSAAHPTVESPACLAADAITILSPGFSDLTSYSQTKPNSTASVEIAAAFLTGLTPTSNTANSGGAHNLPRFLETWSGSAGTVTIRGSLVTMYQSKIATQPFSTNWYGAPTRAWGFDSNFQNGNFPPITPRVISFRRVDFSDLSPAAYTALRHSLWPSEY